MCSGAGDTVIATLVLLLAGRPMRWTPRKSRNHAGVWSWARSHGPRARRKNWSPASCGTDDKSVAK